MRALLVNKLSSQVFRVVKNPLADGTPPAILQTLCNTESVKSAAEPASVFTWRRVGCRWPYGCSWRQPKCGRRSMRGCMAEQFQKTMTIVPSSPSHTEKLKPWRATFLSPCRSLGLKSLLALNFPFLARASYSCQMAAPRLSSLPFPDSLVQALPVASFEIVFKNKYLCDASWRCAKGKSQKDSRKCS